MFKIAILMTCFNRKEKTLRCLESLFAQLGSDLYQASVYLVDDGCTDGTSEAVSTKFPSVNLVLGTGHLYWCGGMRAAWSAAAESDFYLMLNDDVVLLPDALLNMLNDFIRLEKDGRAVGSIVGTTLDPSLNRASYGGKNSSSVIHPLKLGPVIESQDYPKECKYVNANILLIPAASKSRIGILSREFTHGMGDYDYGLRLRRAGLQNYVAKGYHGYCSLNVQVGTWRDKSLPFNQRVEKMLSPVALPPPTEWMRFVRLYGGFVWPLLWISAYVRFRYPRIWLRLKR